MSVHLLHGDCREIMAGMDANSVDAIVTDPPAGISFMAKSWDGDRGGRDQWIQWMTEVATECRRVIKPGSHALVWAIPRTSHWTAMAWENAGWEPRDRIAHLFGSGFPKSMAIDKQLDRMAGAERKIVGSKLGQPGYSLAPDKGRGTYSPTGRSSEVECRITTPATEAAKQWQGWGTALKPAIEDWWLFRAPLSERTVAANVCAHGTGALNIDATRIAYQSGDDAYEKGIARAAQPRADIRGGGFHTGTDWAEKKHVVASGMKPSGRWPANAVLSHAPECDTACVPGGTVTLNVYALGTNGAVSPLDDAAFLLGQLPSLVEVLRCWHMTDKDHVPNAYESDHIERIPLVDSPDDQLDAVVCALRLRELPGYEVDCQFCRHSCGGLLRSVVVAARAGPQQLADALALVLQWSQWCGYIPQNQSLGGGARAWNRSLSNSVVVADGLETASRIGCNQQFDENDHATNMAVNSISEGAEQQRSAHNACTSVVGRILGLVCIDLASRWLPPLIISRSEIVINLPSCPVHLLDEQSGVSRSTGGRIGNKAGGIAVPSGRFMSGDPGFGDTGGASRFFQTFAGETRFLYTAKASRHERNIGLDDRGVGVKYGATLRQVENAIKSEEGGGLRVRNRNSHPT